MRARCVVGLSLVGTQSLQGLGGKPRDRGEARKMLWLPANAAHLARAGPCQDEWP